MPDTDHAKQQALAQLASIKEMVAALNAAVQAAVKNDDDVEKAQETIRQDPLSVEVREGFHVVGEPSELEEYTILLCTGGPAVRIIGDLDDLLQAHTADLEYQDWGTPWTKLPITREDEEVLLAYANEFYYGGQ